MKLILLLSTFIFWISVIYANPTRENVENLNYFPAIDKAFLPSMARVANMINGFQYPTVSNRDEDSIFLSIDCSVCTYAIYSLKMVVKEGGDPNQLAAVAANGCKMGSYFSGINAEVCDGIAYTFKDEMWYVLKESNASMEKICSMLLARKCVDSLNEWGNWSIPLPPKSNRKQMPSETYKSNAVYRFVQISDTHVDPQYIEGMPADCESPLCCRKDSKPNSKDQETDPMQITAGPWGTYGKCDVPMRSLHLMLDDIKNKFDGKLDFVMWTGDIPPHDVWKQSKESQIDMIRLSTQQMRDHFKIPVIASLGNHEGYPVDSFPQAELKLKDENMDWLYGYLEKTWLKGMPNLEMKNHIKDGAFYSVMLKDNLKLISLNTNYCNVRNLWLAFNTQDPLNQLNWLVKELLEAERNDTAVYIVGHIPPGIDDCLPAWSANYYKIVSRFSQTIRGQFFGHLHKSQFQLYYDAEQLENKQNNSKTPINPVSVAYISPSLTTFVGVNPGYRVFEVNAHTHELVNYETYILDLRKANDRTLRNQSFVPQFELLYSAKEHYNITSLQANEWHQVARDMYYNLDNLNDYIYMSRGGSSSKATNSAYCPLDKNCMKNVICEIVSARSFDTKLCEDIMQGF